MTRRPLWLAVAPVVFLLLWSGGYAVAKVGLEHARPMTILCLRYGLVVVIMGVLFAVLRPPLPRRAADWGHLAVVGVLIQSVYFGMTYLAFVHGIAAGTAALLMSMQPILVALIAPRWSGERIGGRAWIGLALAMAGAVVVIVARLDIGPPPVLGFALALLGLAGITGATLWEKRFGLTHHPVVANLVGYAAGLVCLLPFLAAQGIGPITWDGEFIFVMVYLVLGNSVIAVGLLLAMIRAGQASRVSALFFMVPPLAGIIGWFTLGEVMPPAAWAGFALAGVGVFVATRRA